MAMVIRVAFNNRNWASKCTNADRDGRLFKCREKVVDTGYKVDKNGNCLAECWESTLCKRYFWESTVGNFDKERAKGQVFFVFLDTNNSLVLWGMSRVKKVEGKKIYFDEFKPMPPEKWIRGLSSKDVVDEVWKQNPFRYIDADKEAKLKELIMSKDEILEDPIETEITDIEGKSLLRKHLVKERSSKLISAFKKSLTSYNCWICGFDFQTIYGEIGTGFIEAHHTKPISSLKEGERVSTKDIVAVCSNCHRMIHKTNPMLDWKELKKELKVKRK